MTDVTDWVPLVNAAGEPIPACALARVTGVSDRAFSVAQCDTDSDPDLMAVGFGLIPTGGKGQGTLDRRAVLAYEEADGTPAAGEEWGAAAGSWKLRSGKTGWKILGGAGAGLVNVVRATPSGGSGSDVISEATLSSQFNLAASDATWQQVPSFELALPAAGRYEVWAYLTTRITASAITGPQPPSLNFYVGYTTDNWGSHAATPAAGLANHVSVVGIGATRSTYTRWVQPSGASFASGTKIGLFVLRDPESGGTISGASVLTGAGSGVYYGPTRIGYRKIN